MAKVRGGMGVVPPVVNCVPSGELTFLDDELFDGGAPYLNMAVEMNGGPYINLTVHVVFTLNGGPGQDFNMFTGWDGSSVSTYSDIGAASFDEFSGHYVIYDDCNNVVAIGDQIDFEFAE